MITKKDMEEISKLRPGGSTTQRQHVKTKHSELCELLNRRQPLVIAEIAEILGVHPQTIRNYIAPMVRAGVVVKIKAKNPGPRRRRNAHLYALKKGIPKLVVRGAARS